jgi:hypothetical protein
MPQRPKHPCYRPDFSAAGLHRPRLWGRQAYGVRCLQQLAAPFAACLWVALRVWGGRSPVQKRGYRSRARLSHPCTCSCTLADCASCLRPNLSAPPCIMQQRVHAVAVCWNKGMHWGSCGRRHGGRETVCRTVLWMVLGCFEWRRRQAVAPRRRSACTAQVCGSVGVVC